MKYTTPYAELVALEAVSVVLTSAEEEETECDFHADCPDELPGI